MDRFLVSSLVITLLAPNNADVPLQVLENDSDEDDDGTDSEEEDGGGGLGDAASVVGAGPGRALAQPQRASIAGAKRPSVAGAAPAGQSLWLKCCGCNVLASRYWLICLWP